MRAVAAAGAPRGAARWIDRVWPPALYAVASLVLFGLPLLGSGRHILAADEFDSSAFVWFIAWWPHALLHGLNPFVTHAIFYPDGFNLTWAAAMPGPSILLAPVTLAFGPTTTYNLIELAAPALDAWAMFLLCRELTGRAGASLVGGYLFGFSGYILGNLVAGPNLVLVWPLPLLAWLAIRRLRGTIAPRRFVAGSALLLTMQFLTAPEVLATATAFAALTLGLGWWLVDARRVRGLIGWLAAAYGIMVVLVSPYLAYFFLGAHYPPGATGFRADLVSFVAPPNLAAVRLHHGPPYVGSGIQSYLGLPALVLAAITAWRGWRTPWVRIAAIGLVAAVVAALGPTLVVRGHHTGIWLPWSVAKALPVLRYAIPLRLAMFASFALAVLVAAGLGRVSLRRRPSPGSLAAVALAAAAVLAILPDAGNRAWNTSIADPPFFTSAAYHRYLGAADRVLTVPVWGPNERWLADARFPFSLTAGYAGNPFPPAYTRYPIWNTLLTGRLAPDSAAQLRRFVADKRVSAIIVEQGVLGPWAQLFGSLGVRPTAIGGVWLYRLHPARAT